MFFKKETNVSGAENSPRHRVAGLSMLAKGCKFVGKIFLHGDARIGGEVEGTVVSSAFLTIEQSAIIRGDINGTNILLNGRVEGNVLASDVLRLSPSSVITGDLCAKRLIVEDGACIDGRVTRLEQNEGAKVRSLPLASSINQNNNKLNNNNLIANGHHQSADSAKFLRRDEKIENAG